MAREKIKEILEKAVYELYPDVTNKVQVERPKEEIQGDYSSNIALVFGKSSGTNPVKVAKEIISNVEIDKNIIEKVEVAGPGFINFFLSKTYLYNILTKIHKENESYGKFNIGRGKKIQVEFVGSNPTGPLNVVSARAASFGDVIASLLTNIGYKVEREFYINDAGNQIELLAESIDARYKELLNVTSEFPEDGYRGEYIKEIAGEIIKEYKDKFLNIPEDKAKNELKDIALSRIMNDQKDTLEMFGVKFDIFFNEKSLHESGSIKKAIDALEKKGYIKEEDGAKWFKSTLFKDDKDRVVYKKIGEPTYFAADIAYHINKFERGFDKVIDIWGPDHHGHITRMKASLFALGHKDEEFEIIIVQQVNLIEKGEKVKMSKRSGKLVTMKELVNDVGKDVARYFFLMRSKESHLDFDMELARKHSQENPVYYVQYAHARICSIFKFANEENGPGSKTTSIFSLPTDMNLLDKKEEIELIKKLEIYPDIVIASALNYNPHWITKYLEELATSFHKFYTEHRVISEDTELTSVRLYLIKAVQIVLQNGLTLLGISSPEQM